VVKRGAQPGNTNSLKHGFYSRRFRELELSDLDVIGAKLADEVALLRVLMRRYFDRVSAEEDKMNRSELSSAMLALGACAVKVANMVRIQKIITGEENPVEKIFQDALASVIKELQIHDPNQP
jgi:hypothetical protein